jgi:hypothetical protein
MAMQLMTDDLGAVRLFCARYRFSVSARILLYRCAGFASLVLLALSLVQICFAVFPWVGLPLIWDCCVVTFFSGAGAIMIDALALRPPTLTDAAAMIEQHSSLPHPWLSLSLELAHDAGKTGGGQSGLGSLVFERARQSLALCPASVSFGISLTKAALCLASACVFCVTLFALEPSCIGYWKLPGSFFRPVRAVVSPGTVLVPSGTACTLSCVVPSVSFPSCRLTVSSADGRTETSHIIGATVRGSSGAFSLVLGPVSATEVYQFAIGNTVLAPDTIRVAPRPFISGITVRLTPPAYTGLPPSALAEGQGNFAAYPGTRVQVRIGAPFALSSARFVTSGRDTIVMNVSGSARSEATCGFVVITRKTYTFALTDTFGQTSDSVPAFSMEIIPDLPPSVSFVKPGASRACTPAMAETLGIEAVDDIGLRDVSVLMKKNRDTSFVYFTQNAGPAASGGGTQKSILAFLACDLRRFSLYPGDTLFYWATACDNRTFGPPQCATTDTFFFRVPGFEEIHEQIAHEKDATETAVRAARKKQDDLENTAASLMKSSRNRQPLTWEQQQIAKDLKEAVKAQADSLQKAVESFRDAVDKIKQEQSMPPELLAKMDQVQKELENLRKQFGDSLLFKMPDKADNLSLNDLRESLEKFKTMLPDLSQRLDNTLKFLAMLKRDQVLAKLSAEAQRLAQAQHDIASSKENLEQSLSKQEGQCSGIDSLMADIDKAAGAKGDSSLFSKNDVPSLSQIRPLQNALRSELGRKTMPQQTAMNRMAGSLASLSQDFQNLQSSALAKKLEQDRAVLISMAHDALSLSAWQRDIHDYAVSPSSDPGEAAAAQQTLKQSLLQSSDKMNRLAVVPPGAVMSIKRGYDNAASSIDRSLSFLGQRYGSFMSDEPQGALDMLAKTVFDAISDLNNQPQASGSGAAGMMMQSLRRLSGKQAMLNAMTGEMLRRMLGENGSEGEQETGGQKPGQKGTTGSAGAGDEKARREAQASQQAIADELNRLADKYGKDAGASLDKRTRELEEEARRLARQYGNPTQDLRDRQDRFLSRMLETTLSQHRQDEGKEDRVSQSAKTIFGPAPQSPNASASSGADSFYRLRQHAFTGNFPESYRFSVKNYFDSLGVLFLKQ